MIGKPLPAATIARIREVIAKEPELSNVDIAERFQVTHQTVQRIRKGWVPKKTRKEAA